MLRQFRYGIDNVYVVGCGPSLKTFEWQLLKGKSTVAINGSIFYVPEPDYFLTADTGFACKAARGGFWDVETCKVLVMRADHKHWPKVKPFAPQFDHRISPARFNGDLGFSESDFCTGQNSGFCGMQLAVILGAKRIHLLGMDFVSDNKTGNFHNRYSSNPFRLDEFLAHFTTGVKILKERGIQVVSRSPISRLNTIVEYQPWDVR